MKFHRTILTLFLLSICLISSGCGASLTPEETVAKFYMTIGSDKPSDAAKYCSERFQNSTYGKMCLSGLDAARAQMGNDMFPSSDKIKSKKDLKEVAMMLSARIDGNTAKVTFKDVPFMTHVMVREKGKWKLDNLEVMGFSMDDIGKF